MPRIALFLLMVLTSVSLGQDQSPDDLAAEEKLLRDHKLPTEGQGLLTFFRERTLSPKQVAELAGLVAKLDSSTYAERMKAAADLVKAGPLARPLLEDAINDASSSLELVRRAQACLRKIDSATDLPLALATAHMIAKHRPAGADACLLAFAPFATETSLIDLLQMALNSLAVRDGKAQPAFLDALEDKHPRRRGMAGEALIRGGGVKLKDIVKPLLADATPQVRLQVIAALVAKGDKSSVPLLIGLLAELPANQVWPAEDLLWRLAGDEPPQIAGRATPKEQKKAWLDWWEKHQETVELAKLGDARQHLGYMLIATYAAKGKAKGGAGGTVRELRPSKELHWEIKDLRNPMDAHVIRNDRVLIAEYAGKKVTERDFKGNVLWEYAVAAPIACERLRSGETFIATRRQLLIVDKDGKESVNVTLPQLTITSAARSRDGKFVIVNNAGQCQWLDASGNVETTFAVGSVTLGGQIEVLSGQRVLVCLRTENRIAEFDRDGKVVWQANVNSPITATRLPNGNTLVGSMTEQTVREINRDGQEVWSLKVEGRPYRVRRR